MSDGERTAGWIAGQLEGGLKSVQLDLSYLRNNEFIKNNNQIQCFECRVRLRNRRFRNL